jgi:hypothetical protein
MMESRDLFPNGLPAIPLDDLPEPLVPGGLWEPESSATHDAVHAEPDYGAMVWHALIASLAVLFAKVAWVLLIANFEGAAIGIRFVWGLIPYLGIVSNLDIFATIVTVSTIGMAFVAAVLVAWPVIRPGWTNEQILGRAVAVVITFETFVIEVIRHQFFSKVIRWDLAWIVLFELAVAAALVLLALKLRRPNADIPRQNPAAAPDLTLEAH